MDPHIFARKCNLESQLPALEQSEESILEQLDESMCNRRHYEKLAGELVDVQTDINKIRRELAAIRAYQLKVDRQRNNCAN